MNRLMLLAAALAAACASPAHPISPSAITLPPVAPYRWDLFASSPGCTIAKPVPALTDVEPARVELLADGRRRAFYPDGPARGSAQPFVVGDFEPAGKVWALCRWDRVTRDARAAQ